MDALSGFMLPSSEAGNGNKRQEKKLESESDQERRNELEKNEWGKESRQVEQEAFTGLIRNSEGAKLRRIVNMDRKAAGEGKS